MATNFYTFHATKDGDKVLELSDTRREANESLDYWKEHEGHSDAKIVKVTFEAVELNGVIYLPDSMKPQYPMWLKHDGMYAY